MPATSQPPVIIIGAGRSGTNMLRDILCELPEFVTWPCDEINYIWRYGNRDFPTDEFTREMVHSGNTKFIRKQFELLQRKHPNQTVIEKTCANSLRCGFVHELFPSAKFIHLIRDGRDVAASAALRWNASLDIGYLVRKARFVPYSDLPFYAYKYFGSRIHKMTSGKSRLSTWGPKFEAMQDVFTKHSLTGGCAVQWKICVSAAIRELSQIPDDQVLTIGYESLAENPQEQMKVICNFLGVNPEHSVIAELTKQVSNRSIGKWKKQLSTEQQAEIGELVGDLLLDLGYAGECQPC